MVVATTSKSTARPPHPWLAALLVALAAASVAAGPARGPEPSRGPNNAGRFQSGPAKPNAGGQARDGSGASRGRPNDKSFGRVEDLGRTHNAERADKLERAERQREPARNERAARATEARAAERPLREDPTFARLIERVPSLREIVDKHEEKFTEKLTPERRAILDKAERIMSGAAHPEPRSEVTLPGTLQPAVARVEAATKERVETRPDRSSLVQPKYSERAAAAKGERYLAKYIRRLYSQSTKAQRDVDRLGQEIARRSPDARYEARATKKEIDRVWQKVREKSGNASEIYDFSGGRVVYPTVAKLCEGLGHALETLKVGKEEIARVKDRISHPVGSGYRDVMLNLRMKGGFITELRFELEGLQPLSDQQHLAYEIRRELDDLAVTEGREPTPAETRLKKAFDEVTAPRFDEAMREVLNLERPGHASQPRRLPGRVRPFAPLRWRGDGDLSRSARPVLRSRRELSLRSAEIGSLETRAVGRPRDGRGGRGRLLRLEGP
jgi:hypothetical protein